MTSSLKNSLHRRNHKERSQLAHRAKLGFLEKHKDYVLRARDYHSKQDRLTRLRQKAAEKNKDEFYFSMNGEKTRGGVHTKDRGNVALPTDYVKLLKTQDENYVRTMRMSNLKKIDKIKKKLTEMADLFKSSLDGTSAEDEGLDSEEYKILEDSGVLSPRRKGGRRKAAAGHVVFASSLEEAQALRNSQSTHDDDNMDVEASKQVLESEEDLGWKQKPTKTKKSKPSHVNNDLEWEDEDDLSATEDSLQSGTETRRRLLKELSARLHRDQQLQHAQREFEMQRLMMGKGARQKISATQKEEGDDESEEDEDEVDARKGRRKDRPRTADEATYKPRVYKWKLERKR
ncbi:hypothetical protein EST38_g3295 [Candolleomyces aberdarensis]|uniref:U3 small nucleolar RNA-associated protein 11 n=1 Tax=Candolleomyces aberdarensis TaxID=2316362 RepID=A0A4V1Q4M2_9AGAR|nr:hypothetical protein EST38_g3295 [Candolleomyces aberdarensis]